MDKSGIKSHLARNGFVFTDLDSGVRVTARGPKSPADPGNDGERDTTVRAMKGGSALHESRHSTRGAAASKYVKLADRYRSAVYAVVTDSDVEAGRLSDGRVVQHRFPDMDTAEEWMDARKRPAAELVPAANLSGQDLRRAEDALQ
jgi:hypothetical protein